MRTSLCSLFISLLSLTVSLADKTVSSLGQEEGEYYNNATQKEGGALFVGEEELPSPHLRGSDSSIIASQEAEDKTYHTAVLGEGELQISSWMKEMLNRVNQERARVGVGPLCYNKKLIASSVQHNNDMISMNKMDHRGSDGSRSWDRIKAQGYQYSTCAENVARGQSSVSIVMNSWMNSSGHRKNLLNPNFIHFGAAWGGSRNFWTQNFGRPKSSKESCIDNNDGPTDKIKSGTYFIRSVRFGTHLRIRDNNDVDMTKNQLSWEKIQVKELGGNRYAFKSNAHGEKYLRIYTSGAGRSVIVQTLIGSQEQFYIDSLGSGKFAIRSVKFGNYMRGKSGENGNVVTQTLIGSEEQFQFIRTSGFEELGTQERET